MAHDLAMTPANLAATFNELVRERETIVRYSEPRSAILKGGTPSDFIDTLYERFVVRNFVTDEYRGNVENVMVKEIKNRL